VNLPAATEGKKCCYLTKEGSKERGKKEPQLYRIDFMRSNQFDE
jgi:hypothetical protein